jgi:Domain of unknown function (DUF4129)
MIDRRAGLVAFLMALPLSLPVGVAAVPGQEAQGAQAEEEASGYQYRDEGDVRRALVETLAQPDFARLRAEPDEKKEETPEESKTPGWLDRFLRWLSGLGRDAETKESSSGFALPVAGMRMLLFAMAVLILAVVMVFIAKSVFATARDRKIAEEEAGARIFQPGAAPGELPPDEYWRRALAHGEGKQFREGIRELLLGAMSATERRGLIRFRKGLTNRDYFYSVRGPVRDSFARIASSFEHVYFGRREATSDTFRECCREYQKSFSGATS